MIDTKGRSDTGTDADTDVIILPPGQAYNFDTEDLFGNEYLDTVLEQIEKELGKKKISSVRIYKFFASVLIFCSGIDM